MNGVQKISPEIGGGLTAATTHESAGGSVNPETQSTELPQFGEVEEGVKIVKGNKEGINVGNHPYADGGINGGNNPLSAQTDADDPVQEIRADRNKNGINQVNE